MRGPSGRRSLENAGAHGTKGAHSDAAAQETQELWVGQAVATEGHKAAASKSTRWEALLLLESQLSVGSGVVVLGHLLRLVTVAIAIVSIALAPLVPGFELSTRVYASASRVSIGAIPSQVETVRVGLRYGPTARDSLLIGVTTGAMVLRSIDFPDGEIVTSNSAVVRLIAADSRTERVYRLGVGDFSDPLGAEQRLAELSGRLGYSVDKAVSASGDRYVAYIGSSRNVSDIDKLRADLGLSEGEAAVDAYDLPAGLMLEVVPSNGSEPILTDVGYVVVSPATEGAVLYLESPTSRYRGSFEILVTPEGLIELVNIVALEDYLRSAVGSEMSSQAPLEALKAQAVLVRTYVINHIAASKHTRFDVCDNHHCQGYQGVARESSRVDAAVKETSGEVLVGIGGAPVQVYFHSTCGGVTECSGDVWGTSLAHLMSVACSPGLSVDLSSDAAVAAFVKSRGDAFCADASNYRWKRELTAADLARVAVGSEAAETQIASSDRAEMSLTVLSRTAAGRASAILVEALGRSRVITGDLEIRMLLGGANLLPSSFFVVEEALGEGEGPDAPLLILTGAGYGHGVGMCQAGAVAMAKKGYGYRDILAHYFSLADDVDQ